jgi:uncharacterized glyoxalase superfamily protein PhnB
MIRFDNTGREIHTLTPHLTVKDGLAMIEFYKNGLGAEEVEVHKVPDSDAIMHATMKIGDSVFFLNEEFPQHGILAPNSTGGTSVNLHIQVSEGLDELYERALAAGATGVMPPADQFWGDRYAVVADPSGHKWSMGMSIPNAPKMTDEELKAAMGS